MNIAGSLRRLAAMAGFLCVALRVWSGGISEPGIVLYGKVWDQGALVTTGQLTWRYAPSSGGSAVQVSAALGELTTSAGDTYSYRVVLPAESPATGSTLSANVLVPGATATSYSRTATLDGSALSLVAGAPTDTFSLAERGKFERVDLALSGSVPANAVAGSVAYAGQQPGSIVVQVFDNPSFAGAPAGELVAPAGSSQADFRFGGLLSGAYYLRAFRDQDGNGRRDSFDAYGECAANPVLVPPDASGLAIALSDIDADHDGLPDWWELARFGDLTQGASADADGDGESNLAEYRNGTDPTDARDGTTPYADFSFEIVRAAEQTAAGLGATDSWAAELTCRLPAGHVLVSGALTKPAGTAGPNPLALGAGADPLTAGFAAGYPGLAALQADFPPGEYTVSLILAAAGDEDTTLSFRLTLPEYSEGDFPAYVAIEQPLPGAVNVVRTPALRFDRPDWAWLSIGSGAAQAYWGANPEYAAQHQVPAAAMLGPDQDYALTVDASDWGDTWLGSRTRSVFHTSAELPCTVTFRAGAHGALAGGTPDVAVVVNRNDPAPAAPAVSTVGYDLTGWAPALPAVITADVETTAQYALRHYTLTYLAGEHGSVSGPTPQDVAHGADGAEVRAEPAPGWRFVRWSDVSTANPRRDRNLTASLTVTAEFAVTAHTLSFLPGEHGTLSGPTEQAVAHGTRMAPVTVAPEFGYAFSGWRAGGEVYPALIDSVEADLVLTAQYVVAGPVAPNDEFLARVVAAEVPGGRGWWDLSGTYTTSVAGNPLVLTMVHDSKGKLRGTATYAVAPASVLAMPITGSVSGSAGSVNLAGTLRGSSAAEELSLALTLNLTVDTAARQLSGRMIGTVRTGAVITPVNAPLALALPARLDGSWTLRFRLAQAGRAVSGTALLTLSNGVDYAFTVQGGMSGTKAVLSLAGDPADPAARAIRIRTSITPLAGGWARLEAFAGRGYGQVIGW